MNNKDCIEKGEMKILEIGNIISGVAYYHKVDDYYKLIGLQIKTHDKTFGTSVDFYPIYIR